MVINLDKFVFKFILNHLSTYIKLSFNASFKKKYKYCFQFNTIAYLSSIFGLSGFNES